jgi:hypothetical protein
MNQLAQAMQQMGMVRPQMPPASTGASQPTGTAPQPAAPLYVPPVSPLFVPPAAPSPAAQPEDYKAKYANQLAKMKEMGFINEEVNLEALKATHGIIDAAIERIITMLK